VDEHCPVRLVRVLVQYFHVAVLHYNLDFVNIVLGEADQEVQVIIGLRQLQFTGILEHPLLFDLSLVQGLTAHTSFVRTVEHQLVLRFYANIVGHALCFDGTLCFLVDLVFDCEIFVSSQNLGCV